MKHLFLYVDQEQLACGQLIQALGGESSRKRPRLDLNSNPRGCSERSGVHQLSQISGGSIAKNGNDPKGSLVGTARQSQPSMGTNVLYASTQHAESSSAANASWDSENIGINNWNEISCNAVPQFTSEIRDAHGEPSLALSG